MMVELFADLEISKVILSILIILLIGMFLLNRIRLKQLVIVVLVAFMVEHEYLNFRDHPNESVIINGIKVGRSGIAWLLEQISQLTK